jgi:hypothetical protein
MKAARKSGTAYCAPLVDSRQKRLFQPEIGL